MKEPELWYCGLYGYAMVTLEVLETILDRQGVRQHTPDILRDTLPPVRHNNLKPSKEQE